ncbi:MAG: SDR family NAD(P)-dependent oxidoreductase [Miltoncostaeaceae bacterium]
MTRELAGHRAVVTGASRGVGRAVAAALASAGAEVVATATAVEHLASLRQEADASGGRLLALAADLSDAAAAADLGSRCAAALGRVDVLVNNAGVLGLRVPLAECPIEVWQRALAVNVTGLLALTQSLLPSLRDGGAIINVTSRAAGRPTWAAYAISKLAVDGMTGMWRRELADRAIRCVAINPGPARTAMRAAAYPDEDPATVPHPSSLVAPFLAVAAGADPGAHVEAAEWTG